MCSKYLKLLLLSSLILLFSVLFLLNSVSAANCWQYNSSTTCTTGSGCRWKNDTWGSWCEELNCWSLYSQSECTTTSILGKNCTWQGGSTNYWCEKLSCWSLSGTSNASCVNNNLGLSCEWSNYCYNSGSAGSAASSNANCWQYQNQSSCLNTTGCAWGQCMEKGCWSYSTNTTCIAAKDPWNGKNCTWESSGGSGWCSSNGCWKYWQNQSYCINQSVVAGLSCQWKWNSCQDTDCYTWDFTNQSACVNNTANLSCTWSGSYCQKKDCWSYATNATCSLQPNCLWKAYTTSGWCQEVGCWTWDSYSGGNQATCVNNTYGLPCTWSGNPAGNTTNGWCYKLIASTTCANKTTERDCLDTFYCWWQYSNLNNASGGGNCNEPGSFGGTATNTSIFNEWNPKCYVFDMNSTDCNKVFGCNYSSSKCVEIANNYGGNISLNGINCTFINDSSLCNNIPVLSSCCSWQNGSCVVDKLSSGCRDQVQQKSEDSCEDAKTQARCDQIAGNPWYMPCKWVNATSKCEFKASDVFGNDTRNLMIIDNKMNCEAAGGKWIVENYCEGNISLPAGRCEGKFNEEDNCDKACFACENKDSNGNSVNVTNAETSCKGSMLGFCEFSANTNAPNGVGYCKAKEQFKKGIAGDCDSNCGACTYKGDTSTNDTTKKPSYYCISSKANVDGGGCKWVVDNSTTTGGYCINKGEKTCEDSCDRCKTQTTCSNIGRTAVANQTGSCKWEGSSTSGSCVANIGEDVEVCWDGIDNNDNNLVDCADSSCYADSYCGFVSGDCFGWTTSVSCNEHNSSCEWITDKWGSWCDFKGGQCWKYNQNVSVCNNQTNCLWNTGGSVGIASTGWCEKDWSQQEVCMGLSRASCIDANASGCNWTIDTWCSGTGNGTSWCLTGGGWCDNIDFRPKDCWSYSASSNCNNVSGCNWRIDQYSMPHCEVNWSSNCWMYTANLTCSNNSNCIWDTSSMGGGWCTNKADKCWSYNQTSCNSALDGRCYWQGWGSTGTGSVSSGSCQSVCWNSSLNTAGSCSPSYGCIWKAESGWCEESAMAVCSNTTNMNSENNCKESTGCRWKSSGWCDPKGGGFSSTSTTSGGGVGSAIGADCYKYDINQTLCTNRTIINISCGWTVNSNPSCEINWGVDCWRYTSVATGCNATNGCWFKNDSWSSFCTNIMDQCWSNQSYQMWNNTEGWAGNCSANPYCINNSWGGCEPRCSSLSSTDCTNATYSGKCKWAGGWCNPKGMNEMFDNMEAGAAAPLGKDSCGEGGMQASVDICGFGMKDMGDSYGFGMGVSNFENASVCNKEKLSSFVMGMTGGGGGAVIGGGGMGTTFGAERTGSGNETIIVLIYLDTDGSTLGGCTLSHNSSDPGYEFRFKYTSQWNASTSKAVETFNSYKCEESSWKVADIKLSAWKKKMCSDIGGPMIAVKKADLARFPTLYDSTKDIRVSVATIGDTGNISFPTDTAGPGWTTPGAIDFEVSSAFSYGADTAKYEDILKNGFVKYEDCFNNIDDDGDGNTDCNDWNCQFADICSNRGVNAANYSDTSAPQVTGVRIEEYPDAALVMYDTDKPANGTFELYSADSRCLNRTSIIYDIGILKNNTVREYKLWHTAQIYQDISNETLNGRNFSLTGAPLAGGVTHYYKLRVCDTSGKCAVSRCSNFSTPSSASSGCGVCNFVTRIKAPTGWNVSYDVDRDGVYEHLQGYACGANAGMKTNYTIGRKVNVKLAKADGSVYMEFLNATLTKTGLNDKVRTISSSGDLIYNITEGYVGMISETRDKIINNLHPEVCRIKIPFNGTCDRLYHCDDNGQNCTDKTAASGGAPINATSCVWNAPFCQFSTYRESNTTTTTTTTTTSSGGGSSAGGGAISGVYTLSESEFTAGATKELAKSDQIKFSVSGVSHSIKLVALTSISATINISSITQQATLTIGQEKSFDVSDDGKNDLSVKLNSINITASKASFSVKKIVEAVSEEKTAEEIAEEEKKKEEEAAEKKISNLGWILGIIVLVVILVIAGVIIYKKYNKSY